MLDSLCCFHLASEVKKVLMILIFYGVVLSASRPISNLEDQGIPFSLGHHLDLSGKEGSTSSVA